MPTQVTNYQCPACTGPMHFDSAEGKLNVSPAADDPLQSGDFLIMLAPKTMLEKLDAIG